jgi:hypothetical protein
MTNLVSLRLLDAAVTLGRPSALPPNLTRLEAQLNADGGGEWAVHLAGCRRLREVQLTVPRCESDVDPARLIQGIAQKVTGLETLIIDLDDSNDQALLDRFGDAMYGPVGGLGTGEPLDENELMHMSAILPSNNREPAVHRITPPPNMGALSGLQHLDVSGWWLGVSLEAHWRALGGCSSLRSMSGLHAEVAPPAGVTFPHLTELDVTTSTSPGDTLALLGAFPALETVELTVMPTGSGVDAVSVVLATSAGHLYSCPCAHCASAAPM